MEKEELQSPWMHLSESERQKLLAQLLAENPQCRKPGDPFLADDPLLEELETPEDFESSE